MPITDYTVYDRLKINKQKELQNKSSELESPISRPVGPCLIREGIPESTCSFGENVCQNFRNISWNED